MKYKMAKIQTKSTSEISNKNLLTTNYRLHYIYVIIFLCNIAKYTARLNAKFLELFNSLIIFVWFITTHQYDCSLLSQALSHSITYPKTNKKEMKLLFFAPQIEFFYKRKYQCFCWFCLVILMKLTNRSSTQV